MLHKHKHVNYVFSSDKERQTAEQNRVRYFDAFIELRDKGFEPFQTFGTYKGTIENVFIVTLHENDKDKRNELESFIYRTLLQDSFIVQESHGGFRLYDYFQGGNGSRVMYPARRKSLVPSKSQLLGDYTYLPKNKMYLSLKF